MINPLKVATGGYLKRQTKAVLIIAVAGYLNFQGTPIPPIPPIPIRVQPSGIMGVAYYDEAVEWRKLKKRILKDDEELLFFISKAITKIM